MQLQISESPHNQEPRQLSLIEHINQSSPVILDSTQEIATTSLTTHPHFPIPLRPYQIDGSRFLRESKRAFCTYEPGLGKTETAIAACLDLDTPTSTSTIRTVLADDDGDYVEDVKTIYHWRPTIQTPNGPRIAKVVIVCPSFMTDEWFDRIIQYIPDARVVMCSGTRKAREKVLAMDADWYILNYEMLHKRELTESRRRKPRKSPLEPFNIPEADFYIFDESQNLKNHNGKQAQAAADLVHPSPIRNELQHVYLLSGTPIKREPDDLYQQLHIMYPHSNTNMIYPDMYFRSYQDFVKQYCIYLPSPRGNIVVGQKDQRLRKYGIQTPIERLMDKVAHYISYEDADVYRPEVQPTVKHIHLDPEFEQAYKDIMLMYAYKDIKMYSAIEVMHALRAVTFCPSKIESATSLAEQFSKDGNGVMFFTYYVGSAKILASKLSEALGQTVPWIAGQPHTSHKQRDEILDSQPKYLVGTLKSLSVGTNKLRHMKAVVFAEEDWTPDVLEQATDRVRRFGNDATKVFVYYLLAKGTIDDQIHSVVGRRGITAEAIVRRTIAKFRKDYAKEMAQADA